MKELRNNLDKAITFEKLEDAKNYYLPKQTKPCHKDEYLGDDYEEFCRQYEEYKEEITASETLEELADVLNSYTDTFEDGREYKVVEF